jgi:D-alanyl-D-alanine carboxypeptidase/D-alanyl-D-alanine-endopeptidase (penicillin-binding protein 4)
VPAEARPIAVLPSPTLAEVVRDINKFSNNVMARQLFLTWAWRAGKRPAAAEDADAAIRAWLDARGLGCRSWCWKTAPACRGANGSRPKGLGRLLQAAWKSAVMPELMASLPVTATDGTMKRRLKQNGVAGQAHIKTGSLEGVRSIAGYVLDKGGRRWIVVFFVNHANAAGAQPAQDALLEWVYAGK